MKLARGGSAFQPPCRAVRRGPAAWQWRNRWFGPAQARRVDAGGAPQRIDLDPAVIGQGWQPGPLAANSALSVALPSNVVSVSTGSASPSSPADTAASPYGSISSLISHTLPGLWVATTSWSPRRRRRVIAGPRCAPRQIPGSCRRDRESRSSAHRPAIRSRLRWRRLSLEMRCASGRSRQRRHENRRDPRRRRRAAARAARRVGRWNFGDIGIEDQQHLVAAAVENMAAFGFGERLEPQHVAIESLDGGEVPGVQHGFENARRSHLDRRVSRHDTVSFCSATSSPMPFLASAIS